MRPGGIPNNNQGSLLGQLRPGPGGNNRQPVGGLLGGVGVPTARGGPGGVGGSVGVGKKPDMPSWLGVTDYASFLNQQRRSYIWKYKCTFPNLYSNIVYL